MSEREPEHMSRDELYAAVERTKRKTVDLANEVMVLSAELRRRLESDPRTPLDGESHWKASPS